MKKIKVLLIPPQKLPIPAVGGGAIEQLLTNLLDENEKNMELELIIVSTYDNKVSNYNYSQSKIYYFNNNILISKKRLLVKFLWNIYCFFKTVINSAVISKLLRKNVPDVDFFLFQCCLIAKHHNVDIIINEGYGDLAKFEIFNILFGKNKVFYHLHHNLSEILGQRRVVGNSISISNFVRNDWVRDKSIPGINYVLYNGVDLQKFKRKLSISQKSELRDKLGLLNEDFICIFCGRLIPEKGIEQLLEAFLMLQKYKNIKLLLIGSFGFSDTTQTDFSQKIIDMANSMDNVINLGYIPNDDMYKYYAISNIQVIPSVWQEGAGLVSIEGMTSGLPLLITASGGMVEYVDDKCSIKVPINVNLSNNLADKILYLYQNNDLRKTMSDASRKRAEFFSKEKYYSDFYKICYDIINGGNKNANGECGSTCI